MILAWINNHDSLHTYGIELMTDSNNLDQLESDIIQICLSNSCKYFRQGKSNNWLFIEFFGEGDHDKMLNVIIEFQKQLKNILYNNELLSDEPSTELLKQLGFMR